MDKSERGFSVAKMTLGLAIAIGAAAAALMSDKEDELLEGYSEENLAEGRQLADALEGDVIFDSDHQVAYFDEFVEIWGISQEGALTITELSISPQLLRKFTDLQLSQIPMTEQDIRTIRAVSILDNQA